MSVCHTQYITLVLLLVVLISLLLLLVAVKHSQSFAVATGDGASMEDLRETARRMTADSSFRDKAIKIIARQDAQAED